MNRIYLPILLLLLFSGVGQAKVTLELSSAEHKVLSFANTSIDAGKTQQALQILQDFTQQKHGQYAHALSWQIMGNLELSESNWAKAKQHYQQALSFRMLPKKDQQNIQAKLMQANYQLKEWQNSIDHWLLWQEVLVKGRRSSFAAQDYLRAGLSYMALEQWPAAKKMLLQAMSKTAEPKQGWYQALLSIERGLDNESGQIRVLKQLLDLAPLEQSYWLSLATLYEQKGNNEDATALLYSAFKNNVLKSSRHIVWLASGLSQSGNPAAASKVIERAIERKYLQSEEGAQLLIHFYRAAKMFTKAIKVLEKSALSTQHYQQLAQLYYQNKQWRLAYSNAQKVLATGAASQIKIEMLMALCSLYLQQVPRANVHFSKVLTLDPSHVLARSLSGLADRSKKKQI